MYNGDCICLSEKFLSFCKEIIDAQCFWFYISLFRGNGHEGKRPRKRKKGLEEMRKGETQIEAKKGDSRPNYRRKKKERSRREGKRIRESKYNIHYGNIAKEKWPKYLEERMNLKDRRILARLRCGNETKARQYWKEEGEKWCRLCKRKEEDLRHVIKNVK